MAESLTGKLIFAEIPKLPDNWWNEKPTSDPASVWTVWDKASFYLWGANSDNYTQRSIGTMIGGGGMASVNHGPTRGRYHPHFIGVDTMDSDKLRLNDAVFAQLTMLISAGRNVVVPIFSDKNLAPTGYKLSLGNGIGAHQPGWDTIQRYLLSELCKIAKTCSDVEINIGTYWPDFRQSPPKLHTVDSVGDLQLIVDGVLGSSGSRASGQTT